MLTQAAGGLGYGRGRTQHLLLQWCTSSSWKLSSTADSLKVVSSVGILKLCMVYMSEDGSLGVGFFTAHRQSL